jgi:hypothetical protein
MHGAIHFTGNPHIAKSRMQIAPAARPAWRQGTVHVPVDPRHSAKIKLREDRAEVEYKGTIGGPAHRLSRVTPGLTSPPLVEL